MVRLAHRQPFDAVDVLDQLRRHQVASVEEVVGDTYRRSIPLPGGASVVELTPTRRPRPLPARAHRPARPRCGGGPVPAPPRPRRRSRRRRRAPARNDDVVGASVRAAPGRRVVGGVDGFEVVARAVLGQQVTRRGGTDHGGAADGTSRDRACRRRSAVCDEPFPDAGAVAACDPGDARAPRCPRPALVAVAAAVAGGVLDLDPGADRDAAIRGAGVGARHRSVDGAAGPRSGHGATPTRSRRVTRPSGPRWQRGVAATGTAAAARWRPWRAYALSHLLRPAVPAPVAAGGGPREPRRRLRRHRQPVGELVAVRSERGLRSLHFPELAAGTEGRRDPAALSAVPASSSTPTSPGPDAVACSTSMRREPRSSKRVWAELRRIPYGSTASYGEVALRLGSAARCAPSVRRTPATRSRSSSRATVSSPRVVPSAATPADSTASGTLLTLESAHR